MSEIRRIGGGTVNAVVVQLPERNYPGVVIQKDSLGNLVSLVGAAKKALVDGDAEELGDLLGEIGDLLVAYNTVFD